MIWLRPVSYTHLDVYKRQDKAQPNDKIIIKGDMKIDCESRRVFIGEKEINLTAKEFDLSLIHI